MLILRASKHAIGGGHANRNHALWRCPEFLHLFKMCLTPQAICISNKRPPKIANGSVLYDNGRNLSARSLAKQLMLERPEIAGGYHACGPPAVKQTLKCGAKLN